MSRKSGDKKRSKFEIVCDIVISAKEETEKSSDKRGGFKTYIMWASHLSGNQYLYFDAAVEAGLLEKVDEKRYRPTSAGIEYVKISKNPLLKAVNETIEKISQSRSQSK